jgi:hypothetical protein
VKFFDQQFGGPGFAVMARVTGPEGTGFTVRSADGSLTNLFVRSTQPKASIETVDTAAVH